MLGMTMDRMFALVSLAIGLVATAPLHGEQRAAPSPGAGDGVEVVDLRTEYKVNPVGIDVVTPRLAWRLQATRRAVAQSAYEIRVAAAERDLTGRRPLWNSGRVASGDSVQRPYGGPALTSGGRYYWQVRVWDDAGRVVAVERGPHSGRWDCCTRVTGRRAGSSPPRWSRTRRSPRPHRCCGATFEVKPGVLKARAYVTSHGLYEAMINGRRVGDERVHAGMDELQQTPPVPDLRRH